MNKAENYDIFALEDGATPLTPEEQQELIPSLVTRMQLNAVERFGINAARIWAMRAKSLARVDLLSDSYGRELHRRMFRGVWRWAGRYRTTEKSRLGGAANHRGRTQRLRRCTDPTAVRELSAARGGGALAPSVGSHSSVA